MHRRQLLVATGSIAATAVAGCIGSDDGNGETPAQNNSTSVEHQDGRQVIVSHAGEVTTEPDLAIVEVSVEATADSASAVRDELAERSEALRTALLDYGLEEDEITTSGFRISERIDRRQMEEDGVRPDAREDAEEYVYYQGTHAYSVEVSDIDNVGEVIDTAVDADADEIDRVTFTLSDEKQADSREEALREAIQGARSEAEVVADEVGTSILDATVVDASEGQVSPVHRDVSFAAGAAEQTPAPDAAETGVQPDDVTVTARVRVQYQMG